MSETQKYRLRSAGYKRDIVTTLDQDERFIDRESGTEFVVVGEVVPTGESTSEMAWSTENLRICGCTRQQLLQKDVNDCPYCGRRIPAAETAGSDAG